MKFQNKQHGLSIQLENDLYLDLSQKAISAYPNETGGLLVGKYNAKQDCVTIFRSLVPTKIESNRTSYHRSVEGMEDEWRKLADEGLYYVGEWHSHPGGSAMFSSCDETALRSLQKEEGIVIKKPVMIILSTDKNKVRNIGVYCYNDQDDSIIPFETMEDLKALFADLQDEMQASLNADRRHIAHNGSMGDATEARWIDFFTHYLPNRYKVDKAMVIDHKGNVSQQMDIVLYDAVFTPFIFNKDGFKYIPAEGVYAVFEVKQDINGNIEYAGKKFESVRQLERTSAPMIASGDVRPPRALTPIIGGILTTSCSYTQQDTIVENIKKQCGLRHVDIGCCLDRFAFQTIYKNGCSILGTDQSAVRHYYNNLEIEKFIFSKPENSLFVFFLRLFNMLKDIGTVAAIDINAYLKEIGAEVDELSSDPLF